MMTVLPHIVTSNRSSSSSTHKKFSERTPWNSNCPQSLLLLGCWGIQRMWRSLSSSRSLGSSNSSNSGSSSRSGTVQQRKKTISCSWMKSICIRMPGGPSSTLQRCMRAEALHVCQKTSPRATQACSRPSRPCLRGANSSARLSSLMHSAALLSWLSCITSRPKTAVRRRWLSSSSSICQRKWCHLCRRRRRRRRRQHILKR
mmetsp:Transcript_39050/g.79950  ORF Transcript_39050/g.79950 Transcript_39050/m.79950 type:complete len:202 (+) Transcript_39050:1521-2126(+)